MKDPSQEVESVSACYQLLDSHWCLTRQARANVERKCADQDYTDFDETSGHGHVFADATNVSSDRETMAPWQIPWVLGRFHNRTP